MAEPLEEIKAVERLLRTVVRLVLGSEWETALNSGMRSSAERSRRSDTERRGSEPGDLLDYTMLNDLTKIILKNWAAFEKSLPPRSRFEVYMDRLEAFRNPEAHSRDLLPFERQLVVGITGELHQSIAKYRSERGPDMDYYPVVESITDSFGNTLQINQDKGLATVQTGLTLAVGDEVVVRCRAWDPQDRVLTWEMGTANVMVTGVVDRKIGNDVELHWVVQEGHVGQNVPIQIVMSNESNYRRQGQFDFRAVLYYRVDPPAPQPATGESSAQSGPPKHDDDEGDDDR